MVKKKYSTKNDKIALVTGANRGLGYEISNQLSKLGYIVILTSRNKEKGTKALASLNNNSTKLFFHELDVTSEESIKQLLDFIKNKFGRLDVLINNAGVLLDFRSHMGNDKKFTIFNTPINILENTMSTNVNGPFMMCQYFIPLMKKNNYGRIVNISSKLGQLSKSSYGTPCYRLSKIALNGVTKIFADETKDNNILINSVCPGWIKTDMGGPNANLETFEAIDTIIWLATLDDNEHSGGFYSDRKLIEW
jgi:NAD(P)-dependent dehydrogenase (short-subunit alcohol dehydrogenase family)